MAMKSREEFKRERELEEARKAGIAPAAIDADGKEINPHIPQYMTKGLWYLNQEGISTTLMHQKKWEMCKKVHNQWYERGSKVFQASEFRKGACENCGSITHKKKDCLERPRKFGAKITGKNIAADEKIEKLSINQYEAKRDRWNGYDANDYTKIIARYGRIQEYRRELNQKEVLENDLKENTIEQDDEDRIGDNEQLNFDKLEKRVNTVAGGSTGTVRNLRIREDTAKYLLNLDLDAAFYDPKSRSMREDPNPHKPPHEKYYAGDNAINSSGKVFQEFMELQTQQLNTPENITDSIINTVPSQAETLFRAYKTRKAKLNSIKKTNLATIYGNAADKPSDDILVLSQTESYVEYDWAGRPIKNRNNFKITSRYTEDLLIGDHTSVWGSYWKDGLWGYACCRSLNKRSICADEKTTSNDLVG